MNRKILFAAASTVALAAFMGGAQGQGNSQGLVGADGKPCAGVLDDEKNCLDASVVKNTPDRPYRGKPYNAKTYEPSQMPHFVRKGQELIYIATPGGESDDHNSTRYNGEGIIVLDPATNYSFVKRIPLQNLPASMKPEEVSAMMISDVVGTSFCSWLTLP